MAVLRDVTHYVTGRIAETVAYQSVYVIFVVHAGHFAMHLMRLSLTVQP